MEYVAAGDVSAEGVHMLSTGGMLEFARDAERGAQAAGDAFRGGDRGDRDGHALPAADGGPDVSFIPANPEASCVYMKMITLPKLRDALREMKYEVQVPAEIAERARVPIDRMVAIG